MSVFPVQLHWPTVVYVPLAWLLAMTRADEFTILCCTPSPPPTPSSSPSPSSPTALLDHDHNRNSDPETRANTHSKFKSQLQPHTGDLVLQVVLVPITILTYAYT